MPVFQIHHITKYQYNKPVKESCNEIKVFPFECRFQEVLNHQLLITQQPDMFVFTDYWGNKVGAFNVLQPHHEMVIESKLTIRTTALNVVQIDSAASWKELQTETENNFHLLELSLADDIENQHAIDTIIQSLYLENLSIKEVVEKASEYIFIHFKYIKGITTVETTVDEIINHQSGVCQDFAHVLLQILRSMHIPSRYVSGYICPNKNGMRGEGATHAWVEAYIPNYGWAGIDPTNNVWVTNTHVVLAVGKNFNNCSPAKGTFKGPAQQKLSVYVSIGYEDGHTFEEVNSVLQNQNMDEKETEFVLYDNQQQQQQQ
jgi:transglutaminase-like putative cysteine protease